MVDSYGGLAAFIVEPLFVRGEIRALLSVHELGSPRRWSADEIERVAAAGTALTHLLSRA
jgi:hypothetical protein